MPWRNRTIHHGGLVQSCRDLYIRKFSADIPRHLRLVPQLKSWDIDEFRTQGFHRAVPVKLPRRVQNLPPACSKWFIHDQDPAFDVATAVPTASFLNHVFWQTFADLRLPLELTTTRPGLPESTAFHRSEGPLQLLLSSLDHQPGQTKPQSVQPRHSIYLAQCSLADLPVTIQNDLPTPSLIHQVGRGDMYNSSLWLGAAPTMTPLHRDPNPNLHLQLAGVKIIRLYPPPIGQAVYDHVQAILAKHHRRASTGSASFRDESMMSGPERDLLDSLIWHQETLHADPHSQSTNTSDPEQEEIKLLRGALTDHGLECRITMGEALFIPQGWWHSVRGIAGADDGDDHHGLGEDGGESRGVVASVNWWFR